MKHVNAEGLGFSEADLLLNQLPPIPEDFQEEVARIGGNCNGYPNVRVVSGLDPDITEFYGGKVWLKYGFPENTRSTVMVCHKPNGDKEYYSEEEGERLKKSGAEGVFLAEVHDETIQRGIPRYFVEIYNQPAKYGAPHLWEEERYLEALDPVNDTGQRIDMMGEFPSAGRYETWFAIEDIDVESIDGEEVTKTSFRPLDGEVLEFIREMIDSARDLMLAQHKKVFEEAQAIKEKQRSELRETVKDIMTDRYDRIVQTPKSTNTSKYHKKS